MKTVSPLDSEGLGLNASVSTINYEHETQIFQDSVFPCVEIALCDVLGFADVLFVKALSTLFSNKFPQIPTC